MEDHQTPHIQIDTRQLLGLNCFLTYAIPTVFSTQQRPPTPIIMPEEPPAWIVSMQRPPSLHILTRRKSFLVRDKEELALPPTRTIGQ